MSVLVYVEFNGGMPKKASLEVLTYAVKMSVGSVIAVCFGQNDGSVLGKYGAEKVIQIKDDAFRSFSASVYGNVISEVARRNACKYVLMPFDLGGKALAPFVSVKWDAALVTGITALPDTSNGFRLNKNVFSGKAIVQVQIDSERAVLAVNPNTLPIETYDLECTLEDFSPEVVGSSTVKVIEVKKNTGSIALPEAEKVVSGGRGLKGPEHWHLLENLAEVLGAATACSRPVSDIGWRPHHEHVGQTGITVRPNLYIAVGISGAIQHLAGVNGSKVIVVINKDAEAPFFKAADYGVVGDAFEVLPQLTNSLKRFYESHS
jgi:electron transfer flavoprotein alpha subunit